MSVYTVSYNGLTIQEDGNHMIETIVGIDGPKVRVSQDQKTGGDGGFVWATYKDIRLITITGYIFANVESTYNYLKEQLQNNWCLTTTDNLISITRSDGTIKNINGRVTMLPQLTEVAGQQGTAQFKVEFSCANPNFTDANAQTSTIYPQVFGGTPVFTPVPFPVGGVNTVYQILVGSSVSTVSTLIINGGIVNPVLFNSNTNQLINFNVTMNTGDVLAIGQSNGNYYATLNGANAIPFANCILQPLILNSGINTISLSGTSFNSTSNAVVSFYGIYNSI